MNNGDQSKLHAAFWRWWVVRRAALCDADGRHYHMGPRSRLRVDAITVEEARLWTDIVESEWLANGGKVK